MKITREFVAGKLAAYLHHELSLAGLVEWAEASMQEGGFEESHFEEIRDGVARLGLADVRAFGLTWDDCQEILNELGYSARIEIAVA